MKSLLTVFIILFFLGCSHTQIEYLDAKNFIKESEQINKMNSLYNHTYLGKSNSKIYLEKNDYLTSSQDNKTIIYWTKLSDLTAEEILIVQNKKSRIKNNLIQAEAFENILSAIKNNDVNQFKLAYSQKMQTNIDDKVWRKNLLDAKLNINAKFAEIITENFTYKFNKNESKLGVFYKNRLVVWLDVILENGHWKLNEK